MRATVSVLVLATALAGAAAAQVRTLGAATFGPVADGATVLDALARANPRLNADLSAVVVLRLGDGPASALRIDARAMLRSGDTSTNVQLRDGDVLFLPTGTESATDPIAAAIDALDGADAPRAALLCLRASHARDAADRARAVRELCEIDAPAPWIVDTIRARLADADLLVLREAVTALAVLDARHCADALRAFADHADGQVRARARAALGLATTERSTRAVRERE